MPADGSQKVDGIKTLFLDTVDKVQAGEEQQENSVSRQDRHAWEHFSHLRGHLQAPLWLQGVGVGGQHHEPGLQPPLAKVKPQDSSTASEHGCPAQQPESA